MTFLTLMPDRAAADLLPPIAYTSRPNIVEEARVPKTRTRIARRISTMGRPRSVESLYANHMTTTAVTTIFATNSHIASTAWL